MNKNTKQFTDDEIIAEVWRRFGYRQCIWQDEDIAAALEKRGFEGSVENIERVWGWCGRWLHESAVQDGWEVIYQVIYENEDELTERV